ncbi:MOCOS-like protein [Mya arenaria]|uniref:MOCOS-like protein n=1 Tax=Mya arenaria TaxID=6604 RepID=A0ABY7EB99_MYAAR|nr:MOCOS-like protein [Mya arenaria]
MQRNEESVGFTQEFDVSFGTKDEESRSLFIPESIHEKTNDTLIAKKNTVNTKVQEMQGKNCAHIIKQKPTAEEKSYRTFNKDNTKEHEKEEINETDLEVFYDTTEGCVLTDIFLYPVKSCAAFKVDRWPVSDRGLLYDREWMIVTETGIAMSQKREYRLCLLKPSIDLEHGLLTLDFPEMESIHLALAQEGDVAESSMVSSSDCGDAVADWLSEALCRPGCRLVHQTANDARTSKLKSSSDETENLLDRFRGNLVVSGSTPFEEDTWKTVQIGSLQFVVPFGIHLGLSSASHGKMELKTGDPVFVSS